MVFEEEVRDTVLGLLCGVGVDDAIASLCRLAISRGDSLTERRNGGPRKADSSSESASTTGGVLQPYLVTDCGEDEAEELAVLLASCGSVGVARELWKPESGLPRLPWFSQSA